MGYQKAALAFIQEVVDQHEADDFLKVEINGPNFKIWAPFGIEGSGLRGFWFAEHNAFQLRFPASKGGNVGKTMMLHAPYTGQAAAEALEEWKRLRETWMVSVQPPTPGGMS